MTDTYEAPQPQTIATRRRRIKDGVTDMQTINSAAEFWTARSTIHSDDTAARVGAIAELIRLAVQDGGAVGGRAAEVLAGEFGARVMIC